METLKLSQTCLLIMGFVIIILLVMMNRRSRFKGGGLDDVIEIRVGSIASAEEQSIPLPSGRPICVKLPPAAWMSNELKGSPRIDIALPNKIVRVLYRWVMKYKILTEDGEVGWTHADYIEKGQIVECPSFPQVQKPKSYDIYYHGTVDCYLQTIQEYGLGCNTPRISSAYKSLYDIIKDHDYEHKNFTTAFIERITDPAHPATISLTTDLKIAQKYGKDELVKIGEGPTILIRGLISLLPILKEKLSPDRYELVSKIASIGQQLMRDCDSIILEVYVPKGTPILTYDNTKPYTVFAHLREKVTLVLGEIRLFNTCISADNINIIKGGLYYPLKVWKGYQVSKSFSEFLDLLNNKRGDVNEQSETNDFFSTGSLYVIGKGWEVDVLANSAKPLIVAKVYKKPKTQHYLIEAEERMYDIMKLHYPNLPNVRIVRLKGIIKDETKIIHFFDRIYNPIHVKISSSLDPLRVVAERGENITFGTLIARKQLAIQTSLSILYDLGKMLGILNFELHILLKDIEFVYGKTYEDSYDKLFIMDFDRTKLFDIENAKRLAEDESGHLYYNLLDRSTEYLDLNNLEQNYLQSFIRGYFEIADKNDLHALAVAVFKRLSVDTAPSMARLEKLKTEKEGDVKILKSPEYLYPIEFMGPRYFQSFEIPAGEEVEVLGPGQNPESYIKVRVKDKIGEMSINAF